MKLSNDILMNGIGKIIYNTKNKMVGRIADITEDGKHKPKYIILSTDLFSGFGSRYFAIPLSKSFVKITDGGKIVLNIKKDDLTGAKGINYDKSAIMKGHSIIQSVYELIGYHCPLKGTSPKALA